MASRSITVTLRANVQDFKSQFDAATKAAEQTTKATEDTAKRSQTAMGRMVQSAQDNRQAWNTAGTTLTAFGAAALGGLGLATKAAMDWESSWAGVQKTVDGTAPQMAALEAGLRGLARELPASHQEIAAVAEAAGQLGIATPNVLGFTRTMIDMGESTNMSAEEAATSLARFMNVMGTSQTDVGRLGASVVGLGNNFATTESEIVQMSQRLAGAGAQAGMTEGDVMGMAAAMSSVGIEAEAGGSAMSQTMKRIGKAVDEGGESLDLFAQVSGMTAQEFSTAWKNDPASAMDSFINGLSGVESQGMTTNGVLTELGITGIRESDALLRLSAASGQGADGMSLLAQATQMGNDEFGKGTALIEEAAKRYETAESKIAMAKNALVDMGISIGGIVLPAVAELADGVGNVAGWFADLPGPVLAVATGLGGLAGAATLTAGGFLLVAPRVLDTVSAFRDLGAISPGTASKVGRVTLGIGKVGLAVGVAAAAFPILVDGLRAADDALNGIDRSDYDLGMNELAAQVTNAADATSVYDTVLGDLAETGAINTEQFDTLGGSISSIANMDAFGKLGQSMGMLSGGMDLIIDRYAGVDEALVAISQVDFSQAQTSFQSLTEEAMATGATFDDVLKVFPAFKDELVRVAESMGEDGTDSAILYKIAMGELVPVVDEATGAMSLVPGAAGDMADGMDEGTGAVEEQVSALEELQKALEGTANALLGVRGSERDFYSSIDEANELIEENGRVLKKNGELRDEHSEKGRASQAALDGIAQSTLDLTGKMIDQQATAEELDAAMVEGRENFIRTATAMGMGSDEAERLADEMQLIPEYVETEIEVNTEQAITGARDAADVMLGVVADPYSATIDADTAPGEESVYEFSGLLSDMPPTDIAVGANVTPAQNQVDGLEAAVDAAGGTITVNGNTVPADASLSSIMGIINSSNGTVTINGEDYPADQALGQIIAAINRSGGTVEIDGNNNPANSKTDAAKRKADGTTGTIDVNANTSSAESGINSTARDRSSSIKASAATGGAESALNRAARTRTARINVKYSDPGFKGGGGSSRFATGGPVHGPGTGTSDSVPALLSNGEHVLTAKEVSLAGGHDAVSQIRAAIRGGQRFAEGGPVGESSMPVRSMLSQHQPTQTVMESAGGDMYNIYPQNDRVPELMSELQWAQKVNKSRRGRYSNAGR